MRILMTLFLLSNFLLATEPMFCNRVIHEIRFKLEKATKRVQLDMYDTEPTEVKAGELLDSSGMLPCTTCVIYSPTKHKALGRHFGTIVKQKEEVEALFEQAVKKYKEQGKLEVYVIGNSATWSTKDSAEHIKSVTEQAEEAKAFINELINKYDFDRSKVTLIWAKPFQGTSFELDPGTGAARYDRTDLLDDPTIPEFDDDSLGDGIHGDFTGDDDFIEPY